MTRHERAPRISVLLPVFNAASFLTQAIDSILAQTVEDFELLIIDDGSTDGSLATIYAKASSDSRITFRSRENRGLVATLNEMLGMARGDFIARMDADDIADPDRFALQLQEFERDAAIVAIGSDVYSIDPRGRRLMTIEMPRSHDEIVARTMSVVHGAGMCHPSIMFRASIFGDVGPYRQEFWPAEDADLILRIAERGRVMNLALPLLSYRVHDASIGHSNARRQRAAMYSAACVAAQRNGTPAPNEALRDLSAEDESAIADATAREVKWAWWALNNGNVGTARSLAMTAVAKNPFAREAWRALACAVRGH